MNKKDIKIGMKVVPFQKSCYVGHGNGKGLSNSIVWKEAKARNQPYLFVTDYNKYEKEYTLSLTRFNNGDFFKIRDFMPYAEPKIKPQFMIK